MKIKLKPEVYLFISGYIIRSYSSEHVIIKVLQINLNKALFYEKYRWSEYFLI